MDIEVQVNPEDTSKLFIIVDKEIWREIPKVLIIKYLGNLKRCLTLKELENALLMIEDGECFNQATRFLALRSHFVEELKQKLSRKGFSEKSIEKTVEACIRQGYLDDLDHVRAVIKREEKKGYGPHFIVQKIRAKGNLPQEKIEPLMREMERNQLEVLKQFLSRRQPAINDTGQKRKVFQSLQRRGFSLEVIRTALQ